MNKRIEEIAKQAGFKPVYYEFQTGWQCPVDGLEKFAELIVKECLDIMNDERYNRTMLTVNPVESGAIYDAYYNIKSHFGMK